MINTHAQSRSDMVSGSLNMLDIHVYLASVELVNLKQFLVA